MNQLERTKDSEFEFDDYIDAEKRHLEYKHGGEYVLEVWSYEDVTLSEEQEEFIFGGSIRSFEGDWSSVAVINSSTMEDFSDSDPGEDLYGFLRDVHEAYGIDFVNVDKEDFAYHSDGDGRGCIVIGR